jgi:DNA replication protein DnaC
MINSDNQHPSEMTRFQVTEDAINSLKAYQRKLKEQSTEPKQFLDYSYLTPDNLEANDFIDDQSMTLKCKPVEYCGECQQGWFYQRVEGMTALDAVMCRRCEKPRRWMKRLNNMQLPTDAIGMSFATYQPDSPQQLDAINKALEWLRTPDVSNHPHLRRAPNMFLYGPPGNGKSSLLYCYAREAAINSKSVWRNGKKSPKAIKVKFISHTQLLSDIKKTWNDKHAQDPLKDWLDGVDVLLIDEFGGVGGSANKTSWWREQTIQLIQEFSQLWAAGKLQVILTTNLAPRQVLDSLGDNSAAHSRLGAMFPEPIKMVGHDRRVERVNASAWGF